MEAARPSGGDADHHHAGMDAADTDVVATAVAGGADHAHLAGDGAAAAVHVSGLQPGKEMFRNPLGIYEPTSVTPPSFTNAPRLETLIKNGTLYLSLSDAIALALENNLDLAIARYDLPIADLDILRAKAGQSLLGVPTGLVQGHAGRRRHRAGRRIFGRGRHVGGRGRRGSGHGGTGGIDARHRTAIPQFDPTLTGNLQLENTAAPQTNRILSGGVNTLQEHITTGNFTYNQGFVTGTTLQVGYNNNRTSTNSAFNTFNPLLNSNFRATVTQHLLNGFGIDNNNRFIRIARNNKRIGDLAFQAQVISTVSQIEDIYWDLVNAYENVKVQEEAVTVAKRLLSDNQRQVQIGTLAPISIVQAQSQLATSNQSLIVAQTNLQLEQYLMLSAVTRNVLNPALANAPVVPTDTMDFSVYEEQNLDAAQLIDLALKQSPTVLESLVDLQEPGHLAARGAQCAAADSGPLCVLRRFGDRGAAEPIEHLSEQQRLRAVHAAGDASRVGVHRCVRQSVQFERAGQGRRRQHPDSAAQSRGAVGPDPVGDRVAAGAVAVAAAQEPGDRGREERGLCGAAGPRAGGCGARGADLCAAEPGGGAEEVRAGRLDQL